MTNQRNQSRALEFLAEAIDLRRNQQTIEEETLSNGKLRELAQRGLTEWVRDLGEKYGSDLQGTPEATYLRALQTEYGLIDTQMLKKLDTPITELNLSVRARKGLQLKGIRYLGQLVQETEPSIIGIRNFGATGLQEINEKLQAQGLRLGMEHGYVPPEQRNQ